MSQGFRLPFMPTSHDQSRGRSKRVKRIKAKRIVPPEMQQAANLVQELFRVFDQDHGSTLREVRGTKPDVRERIVRASPGLARKLDLLKRAEAFLQQWGGGDG